MSDLQTIFINGKAVDGSRPSSADAERTNYIYIQGTGDHITQANKQMLEANKAIVQEYLGNNAYLCQYAPKDLSPIKNLDFVEKVNVYPNRIKLAESLGKKINMSVGDSESPPDLEIDVLVHENHDGEEVIKKVEEATGIDRKNMEVDFQRIRLTGPGQDIAKLAHIDGIKSIQEVAVWKQQNSVARSDMNIPKDISSVSSRKYEGEGQTINVIDSGLDRGDLKNMHPAFGLQAGKAGDTRVKALIPRGRPVLTNDISGHGTHVAASAAGDGTSKSGERIRGSAPKASLVVHSCTIPDQDSLKSLVNIFTAFDQAYGYGARVSTISLAAPYLLYNSQQAYEIVAGDIDGFVWKQPEHVVVYCAGNDGIFTRDPTVPTIASGGAAKNSICVGCTESSRPQTETGKYDSTSKHGNRDVISYMSGRGPTQAGRIKPDVVAPGTAILSACSQDPEFLPEGRESGDNLWGAYDDPLWRFASGTSMATPLVAGVCALLREALIVTAGQKTPSAALVKALLINGAVTLKDPAGNKVPMTQQGFGRVDVQNSLVPIEYKDAARLSGFEDVGTAPSKYGKLKEGSSWSLKIPITTAVAATSPTIKVTLVWSDKKYAAIQNMLNLSVQVAQSDKKVAEKKWDWNVENNVQQIVWEKPGQISEVLINVYCSRIAKADTNADQLQGFGIVWHIG